MKTTLTNHRKAQAKDELNRMIRDCAMIPMRYNRDQTIRVALSAQALDRVSVNDIIVLGHNTTISASYFGRVVSRSSEFVTIAAERFYLHYQLSTQRFAIYEDDFEVDSSAAFAAWGANDRQPISNFNELLKVTHTISCVTYNVTIGELMSTLLGLGIAVHRTPELVDLFRAANHSPVY
jgi:hypothetical protein